MTRRGWSAPPGAKRTGDTAYLGTGLETPDAEAARGRVDRPAEGREPAGVAAAGGGGARDRQDEGVADRRGAVPQPDPRHTLIMKNVAGLHNLMFA